ncbi:hypothetical protein M011DRAFT_469881 [Sporormia fimetaria CBS 119925]|uniref:Mediator of RNA polymerase II transcription subunit 17 n=1 Tax=Sporormia fimetaria CBS 119925 TaxID=1340428 RepID=A0A6A6V5J4_9PLEO|nr:hypothetical protein M011DRAFT_469881 [Sporormia fimetaria CBS 119925]
MQGQLTQAPTLFLPTSPADAAPRHLLDHHSTSDMSERDATTDENVVVRPWPTRPKEKLEAIELYTQLIQLDAERGHIQNITEQTLREEIDRGRQASQDDPMEGVEDGEEGEDAEEEVPTREKKLEELEAARLALISKSEFAQFYARNTLDLFALILTKDPTKGVNASFSEMIKKEGVPRGSFAVSRQKEGPKKDWEYQRDRYEQDRVRYASKGSRMHALESAADTLLKAATQLENDVQKEVKYWDEVLSISDKGWPLQRLRRGGRPSSTFAVRYGFREASSHFQGRGLAPLRMDDDGSIILDPSLSLKPKTLRIRVSENGKITGTSRLSGLKEATETAVEKTIQLARDSLFEEEIYHELCIEARQLFGYGVHVQNSIVQLDIPTFSRSTSSEDSRRQILIDCIPLDHEPTPADDHNSDWLALTIAEALRLFLAHEHNMRLFRRSQPSRKRHLGPNEHRTPPLLRTILAMLSHIRGLNSLQFHLSSLSTTLGSAGLPSTLSVTGEMSLNRLTSLLSKSRKQGLTPIDQILNLAVKPLDGLATLTLPSITSDSDPEALKIAICTFLAEPTNGTEFKVTLPPSLVSVLNLSPDQKREFKFPSVEETTSYIDFLVSLHLSHTLLRERYTRAMPAVSKDPIVSLEVKEGKKVYRKNVEVNVTNGRLTVAMLRPSLFPYTNEGRALERTWEGKKEGKTFWEAVDAFLA